MFDTPILLIIFNRPQATKQVFDVLRKIKPANLYVAADGPRQDVDEDLALCMASRDLVKSIDWQCNIQTLFRESNLGCGLGPSSAISWFFDKVDEGIILEDDVIPDLSFFPFCSELLAYYRSNPKVMHISGNNFQDGKKRGKGSYYFSKFTHNTGWATWRRAWNHYNYELTPLEHRQHAWDAQWEMSVALQNGVSILPNVNLIKNIGFGPDATHTKEYSPLAFLEAKELSFPLVHPEQVRINFVADQYTIFSHIEAHSNSLYFLLFLAWRFLKHFAKLVLGKK